VRIGEWIGTATERLNREGVESPQLCAQLLLSQATARDRSRLLAHLEDELDLEETSLADTLLARRLNHEPMAYIRGEKGFRDLSLRVGRGVLIPRPETEELLDLAIELGILHGCLLDMGTGSGCIALSIAPEFPDTQVFGCDRSAAALEIARGNDTGGKVRWVRSDWGKPFASNIFDAVLSNPPYLTSTEMENLDPQVEKFEPRTALHGGPDGLEAYRELVPDARRILRPGGVLLLEGSPSVAEGVAALLREAGFEGVEIRCDLANKQRFIHGRTSFDELANRHR
jgi:release factor glutamine methyltransferase